MARIAKLLTEDNLQKIKKDSYKNMIDINYICNKYDFSKKTAERAIKKAKLIQVSQNSINIIKDYIENKISTKELSIKYKCSLVNINSTLRRYNIKRRKDRIGKCSANFNYFQKINTESKAYFLGLLFADGCIYKNILKLSLSSIDIDILKKFKKALRGNFNINTYNANGSYSINSKVSVIQICDKDLSANLKRHGVIPNKTNKIKFPYSSIPKHLYRHFIRGYMDGDGSFTYYINKGKIKGKKYSICFVGTIDFLESLRKIFQDQLSISVSGKLINRWPERQTNIRQLFISGGNQVIKILDWLYNDSRIYLNRKYNKYLDLLIFKKS